LLLFRAKVAGIIEPPGKNKKDARMARSKTTFPPTWNMGDLLKHFGGIAPERIRLKPTPGTATERRVTKFNDHEDRLYELVDGVLVEKVLGLQKSCVGVELACELMKFVEQRDLGVILGAGGTMRLRPGLVRMADVAFISLDRLPGGMIPAESIPDLAPDLAVEVLSEGNTKQEGEQRLKDYFLAGVRLVWYVDLRTRTAEVYTSPDQSVTINEDESLDGGDVLPGFRLPLRRVFKLLMPLPSRKANGRRKKSS
jgi:Uma2 family endonuclease